MLQADMHAHFFIVHAQAAVMVKRSKETSSAVEKSRWKHLQLHSAECDEAFAAGCDIELDAQGTLIPVHSAILINWSRC